MSQFGTLTSESPAAPVLPACAPGSAAVQTANSLPRGPYHAEATSQTHIGCPFLSSFDASNEHSLRSPKYHCITRLENNSGNSTTTSWAWQACAIPMNKHVLDRKGREVLLVDIE